VWHSNPATLPSPPSFKQLTSQSSMELFPTLAPDGKSLAYANNGEGRWDIYLQRVGGQNATNLTKESSVDNTEPAFSPDGSMIAFRSEREGGGIFVMGATGESVRRVSDSCYNPSWSPGGKQIVCASENTTDNPSYRFAASRLSIVDVGTGKKTDLPAPDGVQ